MSLLYTDTRFLRQEDWQKRYTERKMERRRLGQSKRETERQKKTERELGMTQKGGQTGKSERETYGACQASSSSDTIIVHVAVHLYFFVDFLGGCKFKVHFRFDRSYAYICMHATLRKHTTYA